MDTIEVHVRVGLAKGVAHPAKRIGQATLDVSAGSVYIGNHMVTSSNHLDLTFGALADPTRRAILARLAEGEATVNELAAPFDISRPAISKHLRVLERAGLVRRTPDGRVSRCELDARPMQAAAEWVYDYRNYWESQLESLEHYFKQKSVLPEQDSRRPISPKQKSGKP